MVMPLILPHVMDFGASPPVAGVVGSVYGGIQLVSSPAMGKHSDLIGRHHSLSLCMLLSAIGYFSLGLANSLITVVLARIILGIFKHSQSLSKTHLTELVSDREKVSAIGSFNAASNIGFIAGPIVGGHLFAGHGGFFLVACLAGVLFSLNAGMVWFLLPNTTKQSSSDLLDGGNKSPSPLGASTKKNLSVRSTASVDSFHGRYQSNGRHLLLLQFLISFSVILFRTSYGESVRHKFDATRAGIGYMFSYCATVSAVSGVAVGRFTALYADLRSVMLHMILLQAASMILFTCAPTMTAVFVGLAPLSFSTATTRVVMVTLIMRQAEPHKRGRVMGLCGSIVSCSRMLAPFMAGVVQELHIDAPPVLAVVVMMMGAIVLLLGCEGRGTEKIKMH